MQSKQKIKNIFDRLDLLGCSLAVWWNSVVAVQWNPVVVQQQTEGVCENLQSSWIEFVSIG